LPFRSGGESFLGQVREARRRKFGFLKKFFSNHCSSKNFLPYEEHKDNLINIQFMKGTKK